MKKPYGDFPRVSTSGTLIFGLNLGVAVAFFSWSSYGQALWSGKLASNSWVHGWIFVTSLLNVTSHAAVVLGALQDTFVISILLGVGFDVLTRFFQLWWWMQHMGERYNNVNPHVETISNEKLDNEGISASAANEYSYFVDLDGTCGGSLIAPRVVLTAAHCQEKWYPHNQVIVNPKMMDDSQKRTVTAATSHPEYNPENDQYDFQLYLLDEPVTDDVSVTPLSLSADKALPSEGTSLAVMGIRQPNAESGELVYDDSDSLYNFEISVSNFEECQASWSRNKLELKEDAMFCAGKVLFGGTKYRDTEPSLRTNDANEHIATIGSEDTELSCRGDSGGPIVLRREGEKHIQVGVISFGGPECTKTSEYNNVYARTSAGMEWIEGVVCDDWQVEADFCNK